MAGAYAATADNIGHARPLASTAFSDPSAVVSGVSWGAIVAGAAAAAALSLILLVLGVGLGLSSISPWTHAGVSAASFGISAIVWISVTQVLASGMGGYLAGRLRVRWLALPNDEVYFRDTAHGFLAWAVASLATAALLTSAVGSVIGGAVQAGATISAGAAAGAGLAATTGNAAVGSTRARPDAEPGSTGYFMDLLFRRDPSAGTAPSANATEQSGAAPAAEVARIFMNALRSDALPTEDLRYVGQLVAQRTGLPQPDAEKRVSNAYARMQGKLEQAKAAAQEAAEKARKTSIHTTLWLFISLLMGAFSASLAATYGGRQRDL
jgi:hypothetical protein